MDRNPDVGNPIHTRSRLPAPLRLLSFWLGLPVLLFLLWCWRDSMTHRAALNRPHGIPFSMLWPPMDPKEILPAPSSIASVDLDLKMPDLEIPSFGESGTSPPYYDSSIPSSQQMPLAPHRSPPIRPDNFYRSAARTMMQPYYSFGSKEGVVWLSSWISPDFPALPGWSYTMERSSGSWFPAPEWTRNERLQSDTLRIPYWVIIAAYALGWLPFLIWRASRLKRRLATMVPAVPTP